MRVPLDADQLASRLATLPAAKALARLSANRDPVYLVGGAVRDLALGRQPAELDLLVAGDAVAAARALAAGDRDAVRTFPRFGTATVTTDGHVYDLAAARRERYVTPGALPEVEAAEADDDLRRRDFTVNAIALGIGGGARGRLLSVPNAAADLEAGLLRILHAESFHDDPTRLLRMARYAARLDFAIERETARLAAAAVRAGALDTVSGSRIGTELTLMAGEPDPGAALTGLAALGIGDALGTGFGLTDPRRLAAALELLPAEGDRVATALAAATLGMTGDGRDALLDRLALPASRRDGIRLAARAAEPTAAALAAARTRSEIAAAAGRASPEAIALAAALEPRARAGALQWRDELRHVKLRITGNDLIAAGVPAGPAIGTGLAAARVAVLDGRAPAASDELAEAVRAALAS